MRCHLTTLSAGASLFALAAAQAPAQAQNGATAVATTITLSAEENPLFTVPGITFTGTATLYSGQTLFSQSNTVYLVDQNGLRNSVSGSGNQEIINNGITVTNGQFVTNGVPVPVATAGAAPVPSAGGPLPPNTATTTMSYGGTAPAPPMTMASGAPPMSVPASSATLSTRPTNGTTPSYAGTSLLPATTATSGPGPTNAGDRVALGRVIAAVSVFIAALGAL